ncbi:unnamed protein product [Triticum turgidum subsp. durum]|uniref:Uncharacterized protein n=1 Tax=Triticum turgidum subsp. durum TaxID=4567 RepID=A0A9R1B4E1_TRITD|nr:unnamed protein product [Triticum turgidum subsp. durum]
MASGVNEWLNGVEEVEGSSVDKFPDSSSFCGGGGRPPDLAELRMDATLADIALQNGSSELVTPRAVPRERVREECPYDHMMGLRTRGNWASRGRVL